MDVCKRCGKENPDGQENCLRCGIRLSSIADLKDSPIDEPENVCYRHKSIKTNLACGRCGRYLCYKCVKLGPAGPRCPDCAKTGVAVRPGAIFYEIRSFVGRLFTGPGTYFSIFLVLGILGILVNSCNNAIHPAPPQFDSRDIPEKDLPTK